MGKIKAELQSYQEYLDWLKPNTIKAGTDALIHEFNTSASFVRPVVEEWFNQQSGENNAIGD